ncbi:MAG: dihydroneopterin aldolase [Clostridia bacterium]|nr:dihydroneopterin aldolase [Deltaproteobacteria bacterium]
MRRVGVTGLAVDVIVGIYAPERKRRQVLLIDLEAALSPAHARVNAPTSQFAAPQEALASSLDYARMAGETRFILEHAQFELLESATTTLANHFLVPPTADAPRALPSSVKVVIDKPDALGGYGTPRVTLVAEEARVESYELPEGRGRIDVLFEGDGCGVYRVVLASGQGIDLLTRNGEAHDLTLGAGLRVENTAVRRGVAHAAEPDFVVRYSNPSEIEQSFLRVTRPALRPEKARGLAPAAPARDHGVLYYPVDDA